MDQNITNPDSYDSYNLTQTPTSYPILNSPTSTNKATLQQSSSSSSTISELSKTDRLIIRHTGIYKNFSSHVRDGTSMAEFLLDDLKSPIFFFKRFWPSFRTTFAKNRIERYYKKYGRNFAKGELSSEFFTGFFFSVLTSAITPKYIRKHIKKEKVHPAPLQLEQDRAMGAQAGYEFFQYVDKSGVWDLPGIEEYLARSPNFALISKRNLVFLPLLQTMAREIHFRVTSLRMLLSLSPLFFSFADLSTDIYSINYNLSNDEEFLGNLMIGLVVSNLAVQSLGTLLVNSRVGMKWMLREFVFTLLMIKPAIAKFAVLTGEGHKRKRKEQVLEPLNELMAIKVAESFLEAIPCLLIQLTAILRAKGEVDYLLVSSIFISAAFTAESTMYLTVLKDTSHHSRSTQGCFYGFIPVDSTLKFISMKLAMFICTLAQVLGKSFALALLRVDQALLLIAFESLLLFLFKMLKRDLRSWIPLDGCARTLISVVMRWVVLQLANFTGIPQARHPYELGGAYYLFNMLYTQLSIYICLYIRTINMDGNLQELDLFLTTDRILAVSYCTSGLWFVSFALILILSEPAYRHTFWQNTTTNEFQFERFKDGDDATKAQILTTTHPDTWLAFEVEMFGWLRAGWLQWQIEKPDWFSDEFLHKIPSNMIKSKGGERKIEKNQKINPGVSEITAEIEKEVEEANVRRESLHSLSKHPSTRRRSSVTLTIMQFLPTEEPA